VALSRLLETMILRTDLGELTLEQEGATKRSGRLRLVKRLVTQTAKGALLHVEGVRKRKGRERDG